MQTDRDRARVLLVEDEPLLSQAISSALRDHGFDVHVEANTDNALRYLKSKAVDVLFTDVTVPGSMDGGALAKRAREIDPELPVIYASGAASAERHLARVPGSIFLPKPYDPERACMLMERMAESRH
jgi:DNA-binding NtrC family response regulator